MDRSVIKPRVISGEASESDDDEPLPGVRSPNQVVITGEASESDGEDANSVEQPVFSNDAGLPPLQVTTHPSKKQTKSTKSKKRVKSKGIYSSLLHQKLREKNASLHYNLEQSVGQKYTSSAKELNNISAQLAKSQTAVQDVSHNMRLLTNDLFFLEDKIDIIASCNILPVIKIKVDSDQSRNVTNR